MSDKTAKSKGKEKPKTKTTSAKTTRKTASKAKAKPKAPPKDKVKTTPPKSPRKITPKKTKPKAKPKSTPKKTTPSKAPAKKSTKKRKSKPPALKDKPTRTQRLPLETPIKGVLLNFQRGSIRQYQQYGLIQLEGVDSVARAAPLIGRTVIIHINEQTKNHGRIISLHGRNGTLRARFRRSLAPEALAKEVIVF